jgi:hypothetical protein
MEQFTKAFSEVDVDISELIMSKVIAATGKATKEENNCLKEIKELHAVIESTLKENILEFNSLFDGTKARILGSIVKSNHLVG